MDRMPREPSPSRRDVWFYPAAWLALLMLYSAALVAVDGLVFTGNALRINFRVLPFRLVNDVLIYGTLAGVAYAWQNAREVRQQAERAARAEALRARASLEAMRSQLNPHFILNT